MSYQRNDRGFGERDTGRPGGGFDRGRSDGDRGFFERAGDEVRSWFGDDEAERRRRMDERYDERFDRERGGYGDRGYGDRSYGAQGYGERSYGDRGAGRSEPGGYRSFARSNRDEGYSRGGDFGPRPYASPYGQQQEEGRQFEDMGTGGYDYGAGRGDRHREAAYRAAYARRDAGVQPHDDGHHDYRSWRDRQVESFDRDYHEYRRENRTRFENEFAAWRQNRQTQRDSLRTVKEHQEVVGSDGQHVGTVDHVRDDHILLTKTDRDAGGHHHAIPSSWIASVGDSVILSRSAEDAKRAWRDTEERSGPFGGGSDREGERDRGLNRSFPGTY